MDSPGMPPETPVEGDDAVYPCKGCGEILEEGKAFELAGNRWHIDCFRCNTCGTLLDSDANLLLLGDGSLICNSCTYSCSACGNKIEDLAILTGDQAFCASCFKCRNCKRKIENLRYARTSQGIFCMQCHESITARRRKKNKSAPRVPSSNSNSSGPHHLDKSLPALPQDPGLDGHQSPASGNSGTPTERSPLHGSVKEKRDGHHGDSRRQAILPGAEEHNENVDSLSRSYSGRGPSEFSTHDDHHRASAEGSWIPVAFDPGTGDSPIGHAPTVGKKVSEPPQASEEDFIRENFRDLVAGSSLARAGSQERRSPTSNANLHIASQDVRSPERIPLRRQRSEQSSNSRSDGVSPNGSRRDRPQNHRHHTHTGRENEKDTFRLQEPPKKRLSGSKRDSDGASKEPTPKMALAGQTEGSPVLETGVAVHIGVEDEQSSSGQAPPIPRRRSSFKKSPLSNPPSGGDGEDRPSRDDSQQKQPPRQQIPRKEVPRHEMEAQLLASRPSHSRKGSSTKQETSAAGDKNISTPMNVSGSMDAFEPPPRNSSRPGPVQGRPTNMRPTEDDEFTAPREAPAPPRPTHKPNDSTSSIQSDHFQSREGSSPMPSFDPLGYHSGEGERDEEAEHPGLFRKVSKAVRHGRSASDKIGTTASPKWQKSRNGSIDISSPIAATPDGREDKVNLRNKLRYSQQRVAELESERSQLQEKLNGTNDIRAVNSELREKRSTMAFLDTQREMIIRELETMTEHLTRAKETDGPLNVDSLKHEALRDFANSLHRLKDHLGGQIEDLIHQKNELTSEISNIIQMKDKGMQEYESLSNKNSQLTEMNYQLVKSIQDLYRQGRQQGAHPSVAPQANGLGIYTSNGREHQVSPVDMRGAIALDASSSQLSGETEVDSHAMVNAPQLVNIRKTGQPKKFNWKKGSENMARNVKKGFKGAFSSTAPSTLREEAFTESVPYGAMQQGEAPTIGDKPANTRTISNEGARQNPQGWGFLPPRQGAPNNRGNVRDARDALVSSLPADGVLFGSDLSSRCEYEQRLVPAIVTRCIEEVEARGIDAEGIYRKSGSASQVKSLQQGFEKDPAGFDISDPDLDIHAVTSALKQYLRKLPNPLITFECYDSLLDAAQTDGEGMEQRRSHEMARCLGTLPKHHLNTLEFLVLHLVKVIEQERDNLMTPLNIAVVFAPTMMRPQSIDREIADMEPQRKAVQYLLQNHRSIFGISPIED